MLYRPSKNLTLVVYEEQKSTKCFELSKRQLKLGLYGISLVTLLSLGFGIFSAIFWKLNASSIGTASPVNEGTNFKLAVNLQKQLSTLEEENNELKKTNEEILTKLTSKEVPTEGLMGLIASPPSSKDLTGKGHINLDGFKLEDAPSDKVSFSFNITNPNPESAKVTGHILIVFLSKTHIEVYPQQNLKFDKTLMRFTDGERFTASRLRPVQATFSKGQGPYQVKVLIFSKSGDLYVNSNFGPLTPGMTIPNPPQSGPATVAPKAKPSPTPLNPVPSPEAATTPATPPAAATPAQPVAPGKTP